MSTSSSPRNFWEQNGAQSASGDGAAEADGDRRPATEPSPVVRLLRITEQGLVFESWRNFEVGIFIDLGMHFRGGSGQALSLDHKPSFLRVEGFVVDCVATGRGDGSFQVTVLFSDIDSGDREVLRNLEGSLQAKPPVPAPTTSMSRRDMLLQRLEEVFGLN